MTITHSVQQEFLDDETNNLIYISCHPSAHSSPMAANAAVHSKVSVAIPLSLPATPTSLLQVSVPTPPLSSSPVRTAESTKGERWTEDEHERFLIGMELFKAGPWKKIANVVGTRDARQTMSHAQKYRQKIKRRKLGLPTPEPPLRVDKVSCATSTTKRMRTAIETTGSEATGHVVENTSPQHVSSGVQLPWEAHGDGERVTTGPAQGPDCATGPIVTETLLATNNVGCASRTLDREMVGANIGRVDRLNQQLDATLEPLDIDAGVSVVPDSWLGPDELWDFLDGRPVPQPDVVGAQCMAADSQPRL